MANIYNKDRDTMSTYVIRDWRSHFNKDKDNPNTFLETLLYQEGINLSERIVDSLEYAINEKLEETVILQLEQETPILITVRDSEYELVLKQILKYFESNEYYENCVLVSELLNLIINETENTKAKPRRKSTPKIKEN